MSVPQLNRTHRVLVGVVVAGALVIAAIGFAGSYAAVRDLAERKGFGAFAPFFPIGIDAGIVVLLALDLLLTWLRIGFPLLRQTAWLLTAATIAFNGAAAWPDPLGVGMHAVIPVLFVVSVEAARHAVGRVADITADKHMDGVRLTRWLLAFPSTFRLWRRMKLWELRSYDEVIRLEQDRLVYRARLRARYGRGWRRKAPVEALMPLKLARYGVPLAQTAPAGLAAAGLVEPERPTPVEPAPRAALPPEPTPQPQPQPQPEPQPQAQPEPARPHGTGDGTPGPAPEPAPGPRRDDAPGPHPAGAGEPEPGREYIRQPGRRPLRSPARTRPAPPEPAPPEPAPAPAPAAEPERAEEPVGLPDGVPHEDVYYATYRDLAARGERPTARSLAVALHERHGVTNHDGTLLSERYLRPYVRECRERLNEEIGVTG
ncbi:MULTISPECIES: DUF2637 domain-containing protein [Streptomyces]|uniref:DUF2637 domain-containing protein n=1 Tax=Streptomyces TaxID=1883 RepID=UPI00224996D4|nr:DUF2637 domain-containing protein [Streptomyces sp. JHD 1]MCX2968920.1 DUF2637 domain-containing protein [Streptomyces sp. JHD 1]